MPPKRGKSPSSKKQKKPRTTTVHWHLVLVDEAPIRRRSVAAYREAERALAKLRADLETFETRDVPAYHEWEARTFGALLTEIREANAAIEEKSWLLHEIEEETFFSNCSEVTAYRRVMDARARGVPLHANEDDDFDDGFSGPGPDPDGGGGKLFGDTDLPPDFDVTAFDAQSKRKQAEFRDQYEFMASLYEAMTGQTAPPFEDILDRARAEARGETTSHHPSHRHHTPPPDRRLKTLYRKLVQALHPDRNSALTPRQLELWHEVQAAYQAGDLERLEAAAGRVELGATGDAASLPIGTLLRMTADLAHAVVELTRAIARARRQPAWAFRKTTKKRTKIESNRRRDLERQRSRVTEDLRILTSELDDLARRAARSKQPSKKKRRTPGLEQTDLFD